ncbi:MAG: tungstate transport system ATP-binding protein [Syntrophus sp. SKADARSKE-3]|nr:tungstate transport system ATP-binding protein [Syntrophus sp. SKADARSKE-3]
MTDTSPILEARDLRACREGVTVLDVQDLTVREGETLSLIGPNGAGKSTLQMVLARLIPSVSGTITFRGQVVTNGNGVIAYRRKIAMVFQEPLLFDTTVRDNVATGLKIRGIRHSDIADRVKVSLEHFGIEHLADRHARKLSGGEAQRTSLARAFAVGPEIIFLDEPFSSLDPPTREGLMTDLQKILNETNTTAVMATHDRIEALRLSDRIGVMKDGRIVQLGPPEEVMNHPADEFVASFIGMETIFCGEVIETKTGTMTIAVGGHIVEAIGACKVGEQVTCCIRPENVTVVTGPIPDGSSARNIFPGVITAIIPLGLFFKITMHCGFNITAFITSSSVERLSLQTGKSVSAIFKATAVHVLKSGGTPGIC